MITSNGDVIFTSGSLEKYTTPSITTVPALYIRTGDIACVLHIADTGSPTITVTQKDWRTTKTLVDAKTGTGTGDTAKYLQAIEQVLKDELLVLNPTVTFTIV